MGIPTPPQEITDIGAGDYYAVGKEFLGHCISPGGLKRTDRVVEPGCGVGRMAAGLAEYLSGGSYEGFDISETAISWCSSEISSRYPRFHFQHSDIRNTRYNKTGTIEASDFHFPYGPAEFDFGLATSLFTHLLPPDAYHYLGELRRVLKTGGRCLATWFLFDWEALSLMTVGKASFRLPVDFGNHRIGRADIPEAVVAYEHDFVLWMYETNGFRVEGVYPGQWCGKPRVLSWQDVVIAVAA